MVRCLRLPLTSGLSCLLHTYSSLVLFPCPLPYKPSLSIHHTRDGPHKSKINLTGWQYTLYVEETKLCLILELSFFYEGTHLKKEQIIKDRHFSHFPGSIKNQTTITITNRVCCEVFWKDRNRRLGFFNRLYLMLHQRTK